jgi:Peptidase family M1 domain
MDEMRFQKATSFQREKRLNGLFYGLFAGFWLGVGTWALDAVILSQVHANLPWLKFVIGIPFPIVFGGIAGWITAYFDSSPIGALVWMVGGIGFVWIASHIPFQGLSYVIGFLDPDFAGLDIYPFVESARARMSLLYVVVGVLSAIAGGFELFFVESATNASSQIERVFRLLLCFVIFIPIGLVVDDLINASLRVPLQGVDQLIQLGRQARQGDLSKDEQRQAGVRALNPYGDIIDRPYRLILGNYDPEAFTESSVYTDFSGDWGMCSVVLNNPMVCRLSSERYLNKLDCLIRTASPENCRLSLLPETKVPDADLFAALIKPGLKFGIVGQQGTAIIVAAEDTHGDQVECIFRETGDVYLDRCLSVHNKAFDVINLSPTLGSPTITTTTPITSSLTVTPIPTSSVISSFDIEQQAALIDPKQMNLPELEGASRYTIDVILADDLRSFQAQADVEVTNTENADLDGLYFHLLPNGDGSYGNGSLKIMRTEVSGEEVPTELSVGNTVLKVPLNRSIRPGEEVRIKFQFQGEVPEDFGGTATPSGYGIYNLSDGVLALSGWYPILAVYDDQGWNLEPPSDLGDSVFSDIAFYNVNVTLLKDLIIAATGVKTGSQAVDGMVQNHFVSGPAREFFIVASSDFLETSKEVEGTKVNSYFMSGEEQSGEDALNVAIESIKTYNAKFGTYPYNEFDVVAAPMRNALGVEFPGIVLIGAKLYETPDKPEFAIAVAHEVAHQWWYNVVGNDVFTEPWLDEALATYSSSLYYEYGVDPTYADGYRDYWQTRYDRLLAEGKDDKITASLGYFESLNDPSIYGGIVYTKGALFFNALRQEIGDQAFFQALEAYYQSEYFRIAKADNLLAEFEKASGQSLDDFYQQWLYSPNK